MQVFIRRLGLSIVLVCQASSGSAALFLFEDLNHPGAGSGASQGTVARGIDGADVVGYYLDGANAAHGFLYNGISFSAVDHPSASPLFGTLALGISGSDTAGTYFDASAVAHGFVFDGVTYSDVDHPNAGGGPGQGTLFNGIDGSNLVGTYLDAASTQAAFLFDGVTFTDIVHPDEGPLPSQFTEVLGIDGGNIVGSYLDSVSTRHGFVYDGITFTDIDHPMGGETGNRGTTITGIDGGNLVGYYQDAFDVTHAFFYDGMSFSDIDYVTGGGPGTQGTFAYDIDGDKIVGAGTTIGDAFGGYVATLAPLTVITTGDVTPDPTTTDAMTDLNVGNTASGTMLISSGEVFADSSYIGRDVGVTGEATVDGANSAWTNSDRVYVGYSGDGTLDIAAGGRVSSAFGEIGQNAESTGAVTIDGSDSHWSVNERLRVGNGGDGTLDITAGGEATSVTGTLAQAIGSTAVVNIDGPNSSWTVNSTLIVGNEGTAEINITGGGSLTSDSSSTLAKQTGSSATVTVDGAGSTWNADRNNNFSGELVVGVNGPATIHITNGGFVNNHDALLGFFGPSTGAVNVSGSDSTWNITGELSVGGGGGTGTLNITDGGTVTVGGNNTRLSKGAINLMDGLLHVRSLQEDQFGSVATFNFTGGRFEADGTVDLGSNLPLLQQGGTFAPGSSPGEVVIEGGYTLDAGTLEIDIDGSGTAGVDWDLVIVNGTVDLQGGNGMADGVLDVLLDFAPAVGDEFLIIDNDDSDPVVGMFASGTTVSTTHGVSTYDFSIDYVAGDGNDVSLTLQTISTPGDGNGDGHVDGLDYLLWAGNYGTHPGPDGDASDGDYNDDGWVDGLDYLLWAGNYAQGPNDNVVVPEPAAWCLFACGALTLITMRKLKCDFPST